MTQTEAPLEDLEWLEGGAPASRRYGDPYFSPEDGLAESRHVFLGACGMRGRMEGRRAFRIAELGFGTGLNLLAAWALWREVAPAGAVLSYTGFEIDPLPAAAIARAHSPWPEIAGLSRQLTAAWNPSGDRFAARLDGLDMTVRFADARRAVPAWEGHADIWFLDGFAPARNPEMWTPALLQAVFDRTAPGGAAATYSAAGAVRRALAAAGFAVERLPGYGRKRHMTLARKP